METTRTLDAVNDSRQTEPGKYIWGKFTPDAEGTGFQDLPVLSAPQSTDTIAVDNGGASLCQCTLQDLVLGITLSADSIAVVDWNSLINISGYKFIHTTADVTANSPENVTADWFVEAVTHVDENTQETSIMLIATRCDNPRSRYTRTYYNNAWSVWVAPYASYHP